MFLEQQEAGILGSSRVIEAAAPGTSEENGKQNGRAFHGTASPQQQPAAHADTIEVFVNDQAYQIPKGSSVMQACDAAGVDIPRCSTPKISCKTVSVGSETCGGKACSCTPETQTDLLPNLRRFCYHQRLSIAGNCRMCLVEASSLRNLPKFLAAVLVGLWHFM